MPSRRKELLTPGPPQLEAAHHPALTAVSSSWSLADLHLFLIHILELQGLSGDRRGLDSSDFSSSACFAAAFTSRSPTSGLQSAQGQPQRAQSQLPPPAPIASLRLQPCAVLAAGNSHSDRAADSALRARSLRLPTEAVVPVL